jgi:Ribonuclease G/E
VTEQNEPEQSPTEERDEERGRATSTNRTRTRRRTRSSAAESSADPGNDRDEPGDRDTARRSEPSGSGRSRAGDRDGGGESRRSRSRSTDDAPREGSERAGDEGDAPADREGDEGSRDRDGKRRRRRGRRGRGGKGRGGKNRASGSGTDAGDAEPDDRGDDAPRARSTKQASSEGRAPKGDTADADTSDDPKSKDGKGSKDGKDGKDGKDRKSGTDGKSGNGKGGDEEAAKGRGPKSSAEDDDSVEAAIARGGTRLAAKRGRRGNGNGRGGRQQRPGGVPEEVRRAILEGPPRTMLVTSAEDRTQIAVLEDRTVVEHYVTRKEDVTYVGNIYMARVQNVLPGMEAAFLDIGKGRNGVLYAGEVLYDELDLEEGEDERIENALKPGQKVLVQVTKDPMGSKGPRLTMHLSLAGRYMVLAPNSDLFGISRKLTDRERDRLRKAVKKVKPSEHGVIVRTAAEGATDEQIIADLERLLTKWQRVEDAADDAKALTTVYEEPPLVVKVIRDNFGPEFERCIVDDEDLYQQVRGYLDEVAPELLGKVELYGQPTTDARSKAVGAPSADGTTAADDAPADATGEGSGGDDPSAGAGGEVAAADADADRAAVQQARDGDAPDEGDDAAGADGDAAGVHDDADGEAEDAEDPDAGDEGDGSPSSGLTDPQLEEARTRRAALPPLFDAYDVADQLRKAMGKKVWLPSGGYLIIETTEAMKVIDVNTGKFTGSGDTNLEEVVLKTNLEAADEIVRQLRLRDMGGIIIIDFIDMLLKSNQEQVVRRLKRELLRDRTKTRVSEVSKLGLVQMTRKNVSQGLVESFSHTCQECEGRGLISELG